MNKAALERLATTLETMANSEFSLREWFHFTPKQIANNECGTPSCIAGWAIALRDGQGPTYNRYLTGVRPDTVEWYNPIAEGAAALDITNDEACALFTPSSYLFMDDGAEFECYKSTPKQAAKVVRHFLATGLVDWNAAIDFAGAEMLEYVDA